MKLHYMGKYNLNPHSLPHGEHQTDAVPFREAKDSKALASIANILGIVLLIPLVALLYLRYGHALFTMQTVVACVCPFLIFFPHELLHALCFRGDVYLYTNLAQGMLFVVGPETMSKRRFIFMSILPNLVFGFIPYVIAMVYPALSFLGAFGVGAISIGCGDYYNAFNAIVQMPKGAKTYLYQFNSFWYMPS